MCQELPLEFLTREDVDRYLALEFPQHRFPEPVRVADFRQDRRQSALHGGRRPLPARQESDRSNEAGAVGARADSARNGDDLPETVRSMIQRKIAQLGDDDRRLLPAASAQGYNFDSAVVARALAMDAGEVEERLQTLDQTYGFVTSSSEEELPDHTLTLRYRFVHVLYQNALFATLTPSRRAALSAAIAAALLAFYGDDASDVASELAFLFQAARDWPRASEYFLKAARNAARVFATTEAVSLCQRGLETNRRMPDSRRTRTAGAQACR